MNKFVQHCVVCILRITLGWPWCCGNLRFMSVVRILSNMTRFQYNPSNDSGGGMKMKVVKQCLYFLSIYKTKRFQLSKNYASVFLTYMSISTPPASKVHCSISGLENSSSTEYSKVQHLFGIAVGHPGFTFVYLPPSSSTLRQSCTRWKATSTSVHV